MVEQQFLLARKAHISLTESDNMVDFEREAYMHLLTEDLKRELEIMENS